MNCLQAVTRRAASAVFLLFAAVLLVVAPAEASVPRSAGVDQVDAVALASLERPALGLASPTLEPSGFSLGEDLSVFDMTNTTNGQGSFGLCGLETSRCALTYARNNPLKYTDPDGKAIETAWDAINVAMGASSFAANVASGNYGGAAIDGVGLLLDGAATAVPFVPGGAASIVRGLRAGVTAVSALESLDAGAVSEAKPVNLPAPKKIEIADHVFTGHMDGGGRQQQSQKDGGGKSTFPSGMSKAQIDREIRQAYANGKITKTQGERVLIEGKSRSGNVIEMWFNRIYRKVETAYPTK